MPTALGIDVGVRKGLDAVVLDQSRSLVRMVRHLRLGVLPGLIRESDPDVIAIDSPPSWAFEGQRSRSTERAIRRAGILAFATPPEALGRPNRFYQWMRIGFRAFRAAERCGYPRYRHGPVQHTAIEVFPHASAVALAGLLGPSGRPKKAWRRRVLERHGVETEALRGPDQVDAALAALTGLRALEGKFCAPGDPEEGVIVLPVLSLPETPFVRE